MENRYLIHYGIPHMKWYHRRFQNEDGSLTPEGRERYGVGREREPRQTKVKIKDSKKVEPKEINIKNTEDKNDSFSKETKAKALNNVGYTTEEIAKDLGITVEDVTKALNDKTVKKTIDGLDAVKNMSNEKFEKKLTYMTDKELADYLVRIQRETNIRKQVKTADDLAKEKRQKEFDNIQNNLNDSRSIANDTANLARGMKNLTNSNKQKRIYVNPKDIKKMSDDELRAATIRAQLENNYLTASNQTIQKGKNSIDWDKIATIAGIAATGISIVSSVNAIQNRKKQNG